MADETTNYTDTLTLPDEATGREANLVRRYDDGQVVTLAGDRAMANANTPAGEAWRAGRPLIDTHKLKYRRGDVRETLPYQVGQQVREYINSPSGKSTFGKLMDSGAIGGAAGGGLAGTGLGLVASLLAMWAGKDVSPTAWSIVGGLGGSAAGAYVGNRRKYYMDKNAAMYHDPRNIILEKLQGATDISAAEKAKLAAAVRNLDSNSARELAGAVRAALGFGVGALIAKFIFGKSGTGLLFGGLGGVLGSAVLTGMVQQGFGQPFLDINQRLRYNDIL